MNPISGIPFTNIVIYFFAYLVIHFFIGWEKNKYTKKLEDNSNDEETKSTYKFLCIAFKWFPFLYVIFIILMMML